MNDRVYIGVTSDVARRFSEHARNPPPRIAADCTLHAPFAEIFFMHVLECGIPSRTLALRRETHYIDLLHTCSSSGYNEAPGTTKSAFWLRKKRGALHR